jgi:hypothetical protein
MTEEEKWEVRQRAMETIARLDAQREQWEQRAEEDHRANETRAGPPPSEPQEPAHPFTRPARSRDWHGESEWIRGLARIETARLRAEIIEGIGRVIAGERAATRKLLDELRNEFRLLIAQNRLHDADRVIAHLDAVLIRLAASMRNGAAGHDWLRL